MAKKQDNLVIQTVGLTKIFRDFWGHKKVVAIDNLDLEIHPHEVFGLLGPNGSGKSTTIKVLLGLLFATKGWARVLGRNPGDVKANARIGYLPEDSHFYPFLNARETLDFYGRLFSLTYHQRRQRIESLLNMVGLAGVTRRPIGEFSKGMIRRIGLAQALINDPDLLILDEPTAGLDPIGTRQIKDLITQLGRRGKTVLLCSHLLADVEDVCDRICILYGGKVRDQGRVDQLLSRTDMTQIRAPHLSKESINKIKNVIRDQNPDGEIEIQTPRDRLEDYFMRIVTEAQDAEVETSGAVMGTGVSDFLSDISGQSQPSDNLIDQLVTAGQQPGQSAQIPQVPDQPGADLTTSSALTSIPKETTRSDIIDSLVDSGTVVVEPSVPPVDKTQDLISPVIPVEMNENISHDADVDRSVIDDLLSDRKKDLNSEKSDDAADTGQEDQR